MDFLKKIFSKGSNNKDEQSSKEDDSDLKKPFKVVNAIRGIGGIIIFPFTLLGCLPFFIVIVVVLSILGLFEGGDGDGGSISIQYGAECNFEDTVVTVMDSKYETTFDSVSLEDYIIGVACVEIGACNGALESGAVSETYVKAQYVASKTWLLSIKGYKSSEKKVLIGASTYDQQWCDLNNGCVITHDSHADYSYPGDYTGNMRGTVQYKRSFTSGDLEKAHQYYKDIYGELFLPNDYKHSIESLDASTATYYVGYGMGSPLGTQGFWKAKGDEGKTYEEALKLCGQEDCGTNNGLNPSNINHYYANKSIYKLGDYCRTASGNYLDLGEYPNVGEGKELTVPISQAINVDALEKYIDGNIKKVGHGSGAAVAAAASSLIYGLYQEGYYLPYWFGGGHGPLPSLGVETNLGNKGSVIQNSFASYNASKGRTIYSYDCSGFASWAIKNGCKSTYGVDNTIGFMSGNYGTPDKSNTALATAEPGDLMVYDEGGGANGHVRVVVKANGNSVIVAESTAGGPTHGGIAFYERNSLVETYSSGKTVQYYIVHMRDWYSKNCTDI